MNIWERYKRHTENQRQDREKKRKAEIRSEIVEDLKFIREADNRGTAFRRLANMRGVEYAHYSTGWTCFVDVTMDDGYEITTSDTWLLHAIRKAATRVALRIRKSL